MGVPAYFKKLIKKYKIIRNSPEKNVRALYIDANCLFHPQCFKVLDLNKDITNQNVLFEKMAERIVSYIDYLVRLAAPKDLVYIAVDGVAPLAKINQQRMRRFGYANNYRNEIYKRYNMKVNDSWSNIVITPGTEFMYKLHQKLKVYYEKKVKNNTDPQCTYKVIYNSYLVPGEGEHKILQHMKTNRVDVEDDATVIYGLDADLIFLSMASQIPNIYLMRESDQFTRNDNAEDTGSGFIEEEICYADIDFAKKSINDEFNEYYSKFIEACNDAHVDTDMFGDEEYERPERRDVEKFNFINDYIFICYLLGNDFLPHLPSIDIHIEGMETLFNVYMDVFQDLGRTMVTLDKRGKVVIDNKFLKEVILKLSVKEDEFFTSTLSNHLKKNQRKKCFETEPYKRELWRVENLKDVKIEDPVMLGVGISDEWKFRYYAHYFKASEHMQEIVDRCCQNYIEGLLWVARYYFETCPTWRWQYKFTHAPFLSDIYTYLSKKDIMRDFNVPEEGPVDMFTQLVSVIPAAYSHILPKTLQHLNNSPDSPVIDMFPLVYKIDMINKTQLYKCIPLIPYLDIKRVEDAIKDIKVSNIDKERSKISEPIDFGRCARALAAQRGPMPVKKSEKDKKIMKKQSMDLKEEEDVFS